MFLESQGGRAAVVVSYAGRRRGSDGMFDSAMSGITVCMDVPSEVFGESEVHWECKRVHVRVIVI